MALRKAHGKSAKGGRLLVVETLPVDELPAGEPAPASPAPSRRKGGQLEKSPGTTELASVAGKASAEARQMRRLMGLQTVPSDHPARPYTTLARQFRDHHMRELAASIGGGVVGPGAASIVSSAALQMAASRWFSDLGMLHASPKHLLDASRLADASRQNLLAAHELVAREAEARRRANPGAGTIDFAARARQLKGGSTDGT